jgi:AI-2 transport system ATP-binding protein
MVEILRGLMRNAKILILDEPTASLTPGETERLFRQIRALQELGVGIVFISHKLPEIRTLSSHVSVMRDGAVVLSGETAQFDDSALIAAMTPVSREKGLSETQKLWLALPGNRRTQPQDFPVLRVEDLTGEGFIDLNLEILPVRSSAWPGWWDPGAPSLPKRSTACARCAGAGLAGESGDHP